MRASRSRSFGSELRLHRSAQFKAVFRQGKRSADEAFRVRAVANSVGHARLGLAVSRSCARKSVVRHRLKRIVRESFRHHRGQLPATDIVVVGQARARDMTHQALFASLDRHWRRLARQCSDC